MIIRRNEYSCIVGYVYRLDGHTSIGGGRWGAGMGYHVADAFGTTEIEYFDGSILIPWQMRGESDERDDEYTWVMVITGTVFSTYQK